MTFFDSMEQSFSTIPLPNGEISTNEFLAASESLVKLFDLLGSSAFSVVQSDMNGNISKVRTKYLSEPDKCATLQQLILTEVSQGKKTATQGLLWLTRGLQFTCNAIQKLLANEDWELSKCFEKSYSETLSKFHSFVVKPVFKLAMKACPYKKDFIAKLGEPTEKVMEQMKEWVDGLDKIVSDIMQFFESGNYGKGL
ncbi:hypothetical protein DAMA08_006080 [Martiniozyma asiatica (nom. inval.)]|nr:hypothetical protein DAMA08_006080 [Martiniozyma asiatica]